MAAGSGGSGSGAGLTLLALICTAPLAAPCLLVPASAQAQTSADEVRRKLDEQKARLDAERKRVQELKTDVNQIRDERERLALRLQETARLVQASEAQLTDIEGRREELDEQEKLIRGSLETRYASISRLMSGMQRIGRNPPPMIITKREDALSMVRSAMLLAAAYPELRTQAAGLKAQLDQLVDVMDKNRQEGERLKAESARHADAQQRLASLVEERKQSLAQRQAALGEANKSAQEAARSVQDLTAVIERIERQVARQQSPQPSPTPHVAPPPAQPTGPVPPPDGVPGPAASPPSDPSIVVTVRPPPDAPSAPPAGPPVSPPVEPPRTQPSDVPAAQPKAQPQPPAPPPAVVLAPAPDRVAMAVPKRLEPSTTFASLRGRLQLPAQGRRVLSYGERGPTIRSEGIAIETRPGAQITSPCEGTIMYAGEFRSYGQVLIINAGGGYLVLLAGLHQIDVQVGQAVLAGEPIGTMTNQRGNITADRARTARAPVSEETGRAAPVLYVEFRKDGKSIDSAPWWAEGSRKVQG